MNKNIEQRIFLEFFFFSNQISFAKSLRMLEKSYDDSKTKAYEWYKAFEDVREIVEHMPLSGRPSTNENIKKVKDMALKNRLASVTEMSKRKCLDASTSSFSLKLK